MDSESEKPASSIIPFPERSDPAWRANLDTVRKILEEEGASRDQILYVIRRLDGVQHDFRLNMDVFASDDARVLNLFECLRTFSATATGNLMRAYAELWDLGAR